MAPPEARFAELPAEIPVFPLTGALLLPHGRLPLNIFEPRYLAMIEDALGAGRVLGMIQPDPLAPGVAQGPGLYRVGCLGRLSAFSETEDGRYLITLTGLLRFRVVEELAPRHGYRRVRAAYHGFAADMDAPEDAQGPGRPALLDALRGYFESRGMQANWDAIGQMPDQALVVTLAMACPFDPAEKQALLEAPGTAERARALLALLQIDAYTPPSDETPPKAS